MIKIEIPEVCPRRIEVPQGFYPDEDGWFKDLELYRCSFCGSAKPDWFLWAMSDGAELGPTDKNYKVYVKYRNMNHIKFYFQHLNEEQRNQFIELHNTKPRPFTIQYPGYFYVLPFFVSVKNE